MTLLEHIGHRQTGKHFLRVFKKFNDVANKIHGDPSNPLPNPVLLNTDCAGQLINGWITATRKEGQVTSSMLLNNISLPILCWIEFEKNHGDDERTKQATMTAYRLYERLCPSAVHKCRPHVCRAISEWPEDKDRKPEVKNLGRSFQSMFAHVANEMTSADSIRDAMTLVACL